MKAERKSDALREWVCGLAVMCGIIFLLWVVAVAMMGCSSGTRGQTTVAERGAKLLTTKGDQLMDTGIYAEKNVSKEFAEGYEKGLSDSAKRDYWSLQEAQRWLHFVTAIDKKGGEAYSELTLRGKMFPIRLINERRRGY